MSDLNKTYQISDDIVSRKNPNGSVVLMRMDDSEVFYKVTGVAAELLTGLEDKNTPTVLISELLNKYECTQTQLEDDATSFITELVDMKILS